MLDRRITNPAQLNEKFSLEEMAQLIVDFGNSYKETVSMIIANLRQSRLKEEKEKPYSELLNRELCMSLTGKPRHECSGYPFTTEVRTWLDNLFDANGIIPAEFIDKLERIMDKRDNKVNCLVLYGPTNTGKSLLCKIMTEFLLTDTISRRSENSNFAY